jgi:signal transduction histidine kinase
MGKAREIRILLLEDIPEDAGLVERAISKEKIDFVSKRVDSREDFISSFSTFRPDIVLSDHAMPAFNSIEAFKLCRQHSDIPFILVTGTVSEEFAITCLRMGVDDYILKTNLSRLPLAIINSIEKCEAERAKTRAEVNLFEQNEELKTANKRLTKANTELDKFVYSVSHNLRSPISSILGLINLAKSENPGTLDSFLQYVSMIEQTITRLDEIIQDILNYSHNTRDAVQHEDIDIHALVTQTLQKLRHLPGSQYLTITVDNGDGTSLYSDRQRLSIIFNNLINNAINYRDELKEKQYLNIRVSVDYQIVIIFDDNGIGIESAYFEKVFDMFFRGSERSDGAGLGLYIVKETVEKLGGTISFVSTIGH